MPSKLIEDIKYQQLFDSETVTTAATLYNGTTGAVTGESIDTQDYEDINILINAGAFSGDGTLDAILVESDTDLPSGATAVDNAEFTQLTTARDSALYSGSILAEIVKRYVWVRTVKAGTGNAPIGIIAVLKPKVRPVSQDVTPDFDLDTE